MCETFSFFSWVNTHPFDLKVVAFCPKFSGDSYVEFQEKTISGEFFRNFVQTKAILYQNLWNFTLLSEILFWVRIALKKFTQVPSYVVCTQGRRHVHMRIKKMLLIGRMDRAKSFKVLLISPFKRWGPSPKPKPKKAKAQKAQVHPLRGKAKH